MKDLSLLFLLACCMAGAFAQAPSPYTGNASRSISKPAIDSTAIYNNWPYLLSPTLSCDGAWFMYLIYNPKQPAGGGTLVIRDIKGLWEKAFVLKNYSTGFFSGNSQSAIFQDGDTLHIVPLGAAIPEYTIGNVSAYTPQPGGKGEWLAYQLKDQPKTLVLRNLFTGNEQRLDSVSAYSFHKNGNTLLLQTENKGEKAFMWLNLRDGKRATIWSSMQASIAAYSPDEEGTQVVLLVQTPKDSQVVNSIWYYHTGMDKAMLKVDEHTAGLDAGLEISNTAPSFNATGHYIFLTLKRPLPAARRPTAAGGVMVDIWSYKDKILQFPEVAADASAYLPKTEFTAVVSTEGSRIIRLEQEGERIAAIPDGQGDLVVVTKTNDYTGDQYWKWKSEPTTDYLLSLRDGVRKVIYTGKQGLNFRDMLLSPQGDYLVYYDILQQHYFSYNTLSGKMQNISKAIPTRIKAEGNINIGLFGQLPFGIAGWVAGDGGVLIYDNYDIWQMDLSGARPPVNITGGYGQRHHIQFRIAFERALLNYTKYLVHTRTEPLLLTAFNKDNKQSGFYRTSIVAGKDPELLSMGPWKMTVQRMQEDSTDSWIVNRESAVQAPNYFWTNNFKDYSALTDVRPQQAFNWMQAELINFKELDGTPSQGILYKPEDFDAHKKYPLIINCYETYADELFTYQVPEFSAGNLNIPWFVSRGYLVFRPDIHYRPGEPGSSAYNSIMGGVRYLSKIPWVDTARMGLQGHSFGGYETNYMVTHSRLFAAAVEGAGPTNLVSIYGALQAGARTGAESTEIGQLRMGGTLWERQDQYIKNSPVFKTNQVTTPLLIMHNRKDGMSPWHQGLEFFLGLRRLNKKAWMLQYDEGEHGVAGKEAVDYTLRITQFFDHYLKGALPPKWMTEGIPPERKGKETGYDPDTSGKQP